MARYHGLYFGLKLEQPLAAANIETLRNDHMRESENVKDKKYSKRGYELLEHVEKHDSVIKHKLEEKHIRDTCMHLLVERVALLGIETLLRNHQLESLNFIHDWLLPVRWLGLSEMADDKVSKGIALFDKSLSSHGRLHVMLHVLSVIGDTKLRFVIGNVDFGDPESEQELDDGVTSYGFRRLQPEANWGPLPTDVLVFVNIHTAVCWLYGR
jgi:hypothetical protein